jgi:uncharacterized protein
MNSPISDLGLLLRSMEPVLNPGTFAFVSVTDEETLESVCVIASIREPEGLSAVIAESEAVSLNLPILFRAAWITLKVNSDLQAVGLTAAFTSALSKAGVSCNVVAGAWHDHIFVPVDSAALALSVLRQMQKAEQATSNT